MTLQDETLKNYFNEIKKYPLLTKEQERYHLLKTKEGNTDSKEIMIKHNLRLVVKIAKKYPSSFFSLMDLIHEGNLGLMHAVEKFDAIKYENKFSTYAAWWIKQNIKRALCRDKKDTRLPLNKGYELEQIEKEQEKFYELPFTEQINEISKNLSISKEKVEFDLFLSSQTITSMESESETGYSLCETIFSKEKTPEKITLENSLQEEIKKVLETLCPREKQIIEYRFGLNGAKKPLTLNEIGDILGLTRERIRQIQNKSLKKLQRKGKHLETYLYN